MKLSLLILLSAVFCSVSCLSKWSNETVYAPLLAVVDGGFVEHLPKSELFRSLPANLIEGFKYITQPLAFQILVESANAAKVSETAKFAVLCRHAACHGIQFAECNNACNSIAPKVDPNFFERRIGTLRRSVPDVAAWKAKCESFCGKNNCARECEALSAIHFSFPHRVEYEAEFNQFMERLRAYEKQIHISKLQGFNHINARNILEETNAAVRGAGDDGIARYAVLCRQLMCHSSSTQCRSACNSIAMKVDLTAYENYVGTFKPKDISPDLETCHKRCSLFCGRNDCSDDCGVICSYHFSYPNRKEYEAEFFDLMQRLRV